MNGKTVISTWTCSLALIAAAAHMASPLMGGAGLMQSAPPFELRPGVLIDRTGGSIYLTNPNGWLDKISMGSGNLVWTTEDAAKPLSLNGDSLIAQVEKPGASGLHTVSLDASSGAALAAFSIPLPEGVRANIDERMGFSFRARGTVLDNQPFISWEHTEHYSKGTAPMPGEPLERSQLAAYRLDPQSSSVVAVDPSLAVEPQPLLPSAAREWAERTPATAGAFKLGSVIAGTELDTTGSVPKIFLKRWDAGSGAPLADVELYRGEHVLRFESGDKRHILVSEHVAPGNFEEYDWTLFSLTTGELIGRLRHRQSHAWFVVSEEMVIFEAEPFGQRIGETWVEEPRFLEARLLSSGSTVWKWPLRDTQYRGPFPQ